MVASSGGGRLKFLQGGAMRFALVSMVAVSMAALLIQQSVGAQSAGRTTGSRASFEIVHDFGDTQVIRTPALIEASDGTIYGTTVDGGPTRGGTVFRITAGGKLIILHSFQEPFLKAPNGFGPQAPLTEAPDGMFVGTTTGGGTWNKGTIFKMTAKGDVTTIHSFSGDDGGRPFGPLVPDGDGGYFGTGRTGPRGIGSVFRLMADGKVKIVQTFMGGAEGPPENLILGRDGNLYATTVEGGKDRGGSIITITPDGVVTTLHEFTGGLDGAHPLAALLQASDGHFYGITSGGGTGRDFEAGMRGVPMDFNRISVPSVFKMTTDGKVTTLCRIPGSAEGPLVESTDGAFYGTVDAGGSFGWGAAFKLTKDCTFTFLHSFLRRPVEDRPYAGLLRTRDGRLWGTTAASGHGGIVYRIVP